MKQLSWKPVSQGDIYCSPACGGGCTNVMYAQARQNAKKLRKLLGQKWISKVWENLGWYYCAVSLDGNIKVFSHMPNSYMAFFGNRWVEIGTTPKCAVRKVVARAEEEIAEYNELLRNVHAWKDGK